MHIYPYIAASVLALPICAAADAIHSTTRSAGDDSHSADLHIPIEYYRLQNGLKVVLSEDHSVPIVTVGIYYNVGFRVEPPKRTGFAHLFEHLMFQGLSEHLSDGEFFRLVQGFGGQLNASTRADYTNYYEAVPSNALATILWAEAERMGNLRLTQTNLDTQRQVVKEEVKWNVLNEAYGGFPWLILPQHANRNWHNAHNFYGDLQDLDAATLSDVQEFFATYYVPNNAALVLIGDFSASEAKPLIHRYFGSIRQRRKPQLPDTAERPQSHQRYAHVTDSAATRPALAFGYHMPSRWTREFFAFGLLDQVLLQGENSRLHRELVQRRGFTEMVTGGINNMLGSMFDYAGPMLWSGSFIHDPEVSHEHLVSTIDEVMNDIRSRPVTDEELRRARLAIRSKLYDLAEPGTRFEVANLLGCFALFDDDPFRINRIDAEFAKVTSEVALLTAREYLRPNNRTILFLDPKRSNGQVQ